MCNRPSHRNPATLIDVDLLLDEANWRGQTADDLKRRLRAPTLRLMCRELGLLRREPGATPPRLTFNECARAIAQHGADLDMGRI